MNRSKVDSSIVEVCRNVDLTCGLSEVFCQSASTPNCLSAKGTFHFVAPVTWKNNQLLPCQSFTDYDQFVFDLSTVFRQYALTKVVCRPSWPSPLVRTRSLNKCKLSVGDAGLSLRRTRGLHKSVATLPISYWSCLNFASLRTVKWAGQAGLSLSPYPSLE